MRWSREIETVSVENFKRKGLNWLYYQEEKTEVTLPCIHRVTVDDNVVTIIQWFLRQCQEGAEGERLNLYLRRASALLTTRYIKREKIH